MNDIIIDGTTIKAIGAQSVPCCEVSIDVCTS